MENLTKKSSEKTSHMPEPEVQPSKASEGEAEEEEEEDIKASSLSVERSNGDIYFQSRKIYSNITQMKTLERLLNLEIRSHLNIIGT